MGFRNSRVDMIPVALASVTGMIMVFAWAMFALASIDPEDVSDSGDSTVTGIGYCTPGVPTVVVVVPVDCEAVCGSNVNP